MDIRNLTPSMLVIAAQLHLDPADWDELSQDLEYTFARIADLLVEKLGGEVQSVTWGRVTLLTHQVEEPIV